MTYLVSLPEQLGTFAYALGFGFFLGIFYDLFRAVRMLFSNGKKAFFAADVLFALFAAFLTFLFTLTVTSGSIRGYVLFGEALGFFVYYFSLGVLFSRFFDKLIAFFRGFSLRVYRVVRLPFLRFGKWFAAFFKKNVQKAQKKADFSVKKSKILLKNTNDLLYNQHVKLYSRGKRSRKDEREVRVHASQKEKKKNTKA